MKWILIIIAMNYSNDSGAALDHVAFDDRASCERARDEVRAVNAKTYWRRVTAFCASTETTPADPRGGEPEEDGG